MLVTMTHTRSFSPFRSATGLLALSISTLLLQPNLGAQTDPNSSIVGSWMIAVPGIYTDSGRPQRNSMTLFAGGGGMFIERPGHPNGIVAWKQTGDRQFALTVVEISYVNNSNSNNNIENGTIKFKGIATLNETGDLSLVFTFQVLDLDGKVIDSGDVTLTGARIQVET